MRIYFSKRERYQGAGSLAMFTGPGRSVHILAGRYAVNAWGVPGVARVSKWGTLALVKIKPPPSKEPPPHDVLLVGAVAVGVYLLFKTFLGRKKRR